MLDREDFWVAAMLPEPPPPPPPPPPLPPPPPALDAGVLMFFRPLDNENVGFSSPEEPLSSSESEFLD